MMNISPGPTQSFHSDAADHFTLIPVRPFFLSFSFFSPIFTQVIQYSSRFSFSFSFRRYLTSKIVELIHISTYP